MIAYGLWTEDDDEDEDEHDLATAKQLRYFAGHLPEACDVRDMARKSEASSQPRGRQTIAHPIYRWVTCRQRKLVPPGTKEGGRLFESGSVGARVCDPQHARAHDRTWNFETRSARTSPLRLTEPRSVKGLKTPKNTPKIKN